MRLSPPSWRTSPNTRTRTAIIKAQRERNDVQGVGGVGGAGGGGDDEGDRERGD